jgi:hypothetical protein
VAAIPMACPRERKKLVSRSGSERATRAAVP